MKISRLIRPALLVALGGAIVWLALHREILQSAELEQELRRFGPCSPILFVLVYSLASVLFVPGSILTVAGGALFGPLWGTLWNLSGATLGAALAFAIARYVGADWVTRRAGERLARLIRGRRRRLALRRVRAAGAAVPIQLVNYAFGVTRVGLGEYAITSFVCMAPGALAYTYLGYAGLEAASGRAGAIHKALVALALLAAVAFLPRLVRRLRGQHHTDAASLKRCLESGERVALVDVRTAEEFRGPLGHIAGATNIPIPEISGKVSELTDIKGPIITI
jgi:uncharacterized membrane protein YdjX (TVP38/TMEM64 family)